MLRPVIVLILTMVWCIGLTAPEWVSDPDAPPDVMPAACTAVRIDPGGYDAILYAAAGRALLPPTVRDAIAQDDLAALRYLIRAVRRPGVQPGLPLPTQSRPLLHALNALTTQPDRARLSADYLTALYLHYGPDSALAVALARHHTQADPVLALLLERDGASVLGLQHVQRCAELTRAPTLKAQCGHPLVRYTLPHRDGGGQPVVWPTWGDQRLPGCESDVALAERLLMWLPTWRENPEAYADPVWRACYAGLVQNLAQRGDTRLDQTLVDTVHPAQINARDVRRQLAYHLAHHRAWPWSWSRSTFEHSLLALSPRDAHYAKIICRCLSFTPSRVEVYPPLAPAL